MLAVTPLIARFLWDDANLAHIARHSVSQVEVEQAFVDPFARLEGNMQRKGEVRFRMLGETLDERLPSVVFVIRAGGIRTVTAHDVRGKLLADYKAGRLR